VRLSSPMTTFAVIIRLRPQWFYVYDLIIRPGRPLDFRNRARCNASDSSLASERLRNLARRTHAAMTSVPRLTYYNGFQWLTTRPDGTRPDRARVVQSLRRGDSRLAVARAEIRYERKPVAVR